MNKNRVSVFKKTLDNWCGSYTIGNECFVEVIFNGKIANDTYRTCAWGNDDFGMEFDCNTEEEAWEVFLKVIGMEYVHIYELKKLGFVYR